MLMAYLIDRETSNAMESLFKNDDIEILDSLRLDKTNAVYIYENSQIINGPHAKFIVFANSLSCDIKNKEALLGSSEIRGFQKENKDTIYIYSISNFPTQKLDNGYILFRVDANTENAQDSLKKKNLKYKVIHCN